MHEEGFYYVEKGKIYARDVEDFSISKTSSNY